MTKKSLAAHRRNAKLSSGPATPEGRQRMRDANLRHGFYSKSEEVALRALGEDPAEFRMLREALRGKSTSVDTLEEQIADRLARSFSLLNRADRMQEGHALHKAREEDCKREGRLHMQMMHLKMTARELALPLPVGSAPVLRHPSLRPRPHEAIAQGGHGERYERSGAGPLLPASRAGDAGAGRSGF